MILIFDTYGGLCNQMYDIMNAINFCLKYNIQFTFRYCSFRNDNLNSWTEQPFEKLFDSNFYKYKQYIHYDTIKDKLTNDNCYNLNDKRLSNTFLSDILNDLTKIKKEYIVLKQFWSVYKFKNVIDPNVHLHILPSMDIMEKYIELKNTLPEYNFIHYRYEKDFTDHFKIKVPELKHLLQNIKFKQKLKIYVATSNINQFELNDIELNDILHKNDDILENYEQRAFVDYMVGLKSVEAYGHKKSSFSCMINNIKSTNNYYA